MKKNFKKSKFVILPALATLVLTGVASVTGTVAWFTANTRVTASGMTFKAKADSNLLIATSAADATDLVDEGLFGTAITGSASGSLTPVSTTDAKSFWKLGTGNTVSGTGAATNNTFVAADNTVTEAKAYLEYAFQLKAMNLASSAQDIIIDSLSLKYGSETSVTGYEAFRVAVFVEDNTQTDSGTTRTGNFNKALNTWNSSYAPEGYEYFTKSSEKNQAATSTSAKGDVTITNAKTSLASVSDGETSYYKVVVRLWLEGEDKKCNVDTFKAFTAGNWQFDLSLKLAANTNDAVTSLGYNTYTA